MFIAIHLKRLFCVFLSAFLYYGSNSYAQVDNSICSQLSRVLDGRRPEKPDVLYIESHYKGGGDTEYLNLDIDKDGLADSVVQSCGSLNMPCSLFVTLSTGNSMELLDEGRFFLGRYKSKVYVIVGDSQSESAGSKRGKRRIFKITAIDIKLVCSKV